MKILVIGMDNTGKTTLCKELSERLNLKWVKSLGPNKSKEELEEYLIDNLESEESSVFERFSLFDEMVYGKVLRGISKFNFDSVVYQTLKEVKPIIIYCRPEAETIFNWNDREQMDGVIEQSQTLITQWDLLIDRLHDDKPYSKFIEWDYKHNTLENILEQVKY